VATDPREEQLRDLIRGGTMIPPDDPFEQKRLIAKGVFRVHAAKVLPRLPADADEIPADLIPSPDTITCRHCGRPVTRWDEPCGRDMMVIVRPG
jgi:hypothetical protein